MTEINSFFHAQSAVRKWGGEIDDFIKIEEFLDSSKKSLATYVIDPSTITH